jgi:hypothetical protein
VDKHEQICGVVMVCGVLTPISTIFQLYQCDQFYWQRKPPEPSSSTFDVTLMVAILRNLRYMVVYDGPPSTYKNLTDSAAVSTIKYYRNQIVHSSTGQLSDNEFNIIFDEIVEVILYIYCMLVREI